MGSKARSIKRAATRTAAVGKPTLGQVIERMAQAIDANTRMIAELERIVQEQAKLNEKIEIVNTVSLDAEKVGELFPAAKED